ncbi:hypothetical protein RIF29_24229 [Crotalaria pallida]|uniref:Plus3 domain-containing protein n=1 Tax=Crotalaria pallida TaxID=3830 RepID=A0AAN9EJD4_CROPI
MLSRTYSMTTKRKRKSKSSQNQEQEVEDWCFDCKDGGEMAICRHRKSAKFFCIGCPDSSFCKKCFNSSDFTILKGEKGLCRKCLKLVVIIEENLEHDSEGKIINLNDMETCEGLFKEYWEVVKVKERLTNDDITTAIEKYKKGEQFLVQSNSNEGNDITIALDNIAKDDENFLLQSNSSRPMESDEDFTIKIKSLLRRKKTNAQHASRPSSSRGKSILEKGDEFIKPGSIASINAKNIKLVYLKQSLVLKFLQQRESFMDKVVGAFVRVKVGSGGCNQKSSHHLVKVIGVLFDEMPNGILLQVSFMANAIPISEISDLDFTEEECEDLQQKVKAGLLPKLTVRKNYMLCFLNHLCYTKDEYIDEKEELEQTRKQEALLRNVPLVSAELIKEKYDPEEDKHELDGDSQ